MRVWMQQTGVPLLATMSFVLISFAATYSAHRLGFLQAAEFEVYDRLMALRASSRPVDSPCVIVGGDDADSWGANFPMSDRMMADLLTKLVQGEPKAIGVDIYRSISMPQREISAEAADADRARLEALIENPKKNHKVPIIMPRLLGGDNVKEVPPPTFFKNPLQMWHVGAVDLHPDDYDQVLRRALLSRSLKPADKALTPDDKVQVDSMAVALSRCYLAKLKPAVPLSLEAHFTRFLANDGDYVDDDAGGFQILIDYGGPQTFTELPVSKVLSPDFNPDVLKDRVVLVGMTDLKLKDFFRTPLKPREAGVELHARITDQIIRAATQGGAVISVPSRTKLMQGLFFMCGIGGALGAGVRSYWKFFIATAAVLATLILAAAVSMKHGLWLPITQPAIGFVLSAAMVTVYMSYRERLDRLAMMQLFERSVSGAVAKSIWQRRNEIFEGGRLRTRDSCGTVLFTDLAGFSRIAETLEAAPLIDWLNEYFDKISDLVCKWGGNINKFNGDQIVAVFGPPLDRNDEEMTADARGAVSCAVEMRAKLCDLNQDWEKRGMPQARMRIGVHTGPLVAGSLGSRERQEWTVIGDTVNIASRLESFDKTEMSDDIAAGGCRILISSTTLGRLEAEKLEARSLGQHELTGRQQKIEILGVIDYVHSAQPPPFVAAPATTSHAKESKQVCRVP